MKAGILPLQNHAWRVVTQALLKKGWIRASLAVVAAESLVFVPVLLARLRALVSRPEHIDERFFPYFALCATGAVCIIVMRILSARRERLDAVNACAIAAPFVAVLHFLLLLLVFGHRSNDYSIYEKAARSIISGSDPWAGSTLGYIYPPLLAQCIGLAHRIGQAMMGSSSAGWEAAFYIYQAHQFLLVCLFSGLLYRFCRNLGWDETVSAIAVTVCILINLPLLVALNWNQASLAVAALFLAALILAERHPVAAGLSLALGAHLKLYPLVLVVPWFVTKKYRALASSLAGLVCFAFVPSLLVGSYTAWGNYKQFLSNYSRVGFFIRDGGTNYVYEHAARSVSPSSLLFLALMLLLLNVMFWGRFVRRERKWSELKKSPAAVLTADLSDRFRYYGHAMDAIAVALFAAPLVWKHHYLLAVPLALWAVTHVSRERLKWFGLAVLLLLGPRVPRLFGIDWSGPLAIVLFLYCIPAHSLGNRLFSRCYTARRRAQGAAPVDFPNI